MPKYRFKGFYKTDKNKGSKDVVRYYFSAPNDAAARKKVKVFRKPKTSIRDGKLRRESSKGWTIRVTLSGKSRKKQ